MKQIIKLSWYGQSLAAFCSLLGSIGVLYYSLRMLSTTSSFGQLFQDIVMPSLAGLIVLLLIGIFSLLKKPIAIALSVIYTYFAIRNVRIYVDTYQQNHHAQFGQYGTIQVSFGILDTANTLGVFAGLIMSLFGLFLAIHYIRQYLRQH